MKKLAFTLALTFLVYFSHGQPTTFRQLDIATNSDSQQLLTDKIKFIKNNKLDINKSKTALDSIVWYLGRHPKTIISLTLQKIKTADSDADAGKAGQDQSKQIVNYLSEKGINSKQIVSAVNYIEDSPADNPSVKVRIRVLSNDFKDSGTK